MLLPVKSDEGVHVTREFFLRNVFPVIHSWLCVQPNFRTANTFGALLTPI